MKSEPKDEEFQAQTTTVWSFPNRGKWLTHNAKYRGNWAPQIPGNIIRLYSKEELITALNKSNLAIEMIFGSYTGESFDEKSSSRLILLCKKKK